ncbi:MFS transporter [Corynebacterium sp. AOP40-9SA-29]|uniref:MFS transporter n=1 Tax=Corynebacterium sp. AOP40-9SA-29 TaxID=3457677 RepID=UPI004033A146
MTLRESTIAEQDLADAQFDPADSRKPLMDTKSILLMNLGFFGVNYAMGLQQSAVNPLFTIIGADPDNLPLLNLAGPVTGLLIQPVIGVLSDRTWTRWGRRKPFFVVGVIVAALMLFLFPFVAALWMAVVLLWMLDAGANTSMEPYRALIADKLRLSQRTTGYLLQGMLIGAGTVVANLSLFVFQKLISGSNAAGVPYWVPATFWVGACFLLVSVAISAAKTKEIKPPQAEIDRVRALPKNPVAVFSEIVYAVRDMPAGMHKIGIVYMFQWYALFIWWQFGSHVVGQSAYDVDTSVRGFGQTQAFQDAAGWTGLLNGWYNLVAVAAALIMIPLARRFGAKYVHAVALGAAGIGMVVFPFVPNEYAMFIPMIGLGIGWASVCSLPFVMVTSMVPAARIGVYLGVLNMMIVVPQLIETLTFGWIYRNLLDSNPTYACLVVGVMFALGGLSSTWINAPRADEESSLMPFGSPRRLTSVYKKVVVGTDGSDEALVAVGHAAGLAAAAQARLVVVVAYRPGDPNEPDGPDQAAVHNGETGPMDVVDPLDVIHHRLYGEEQADEAMQRTIKKLRQGGFTRVDQRRVKAKPSRALLRVAGADPHNLIVVGNRGRRATEGDVLGSISRRVTSEAACNVLIVQAGDEAQARADETAEAD